MTPLPTEIPGTNQYITTHSTVFTISGIFHHRKSYGRNLRSHRQRGYRGHEHLWFHPRHVTNPDNPQKAIGYIRHTNHSISLIFLGHIFQAMKRRLFPL